jgi:hypothetical protein
MSTMMFADQRGAFVAHARRIVARAEFWCTGRRARCGKEAFDDLNAGSSQVRLSSCGNG